MESFISKREKTPEIGKYFSPKSTPENTHGLSQKIQGTYFKISALYFKIYALYFSPFQIAEKQCLEKPQKSAVSGCGFGGSENEKKLVCCHDWGIKVAW